MDEEEESKSHKFQLHTHTEGEHDLTTCTTGEAGCSLGGCLSSVGLFANANGDA